MSIVILTVEVRDEVVDILLSVRSEEESRSVRKDVDGLDVEIEVGKNVVDDRIEEDDVKVGVGEGVGDVEHVLLRCY